MTVLGRTGIDILPIVLGGNTFGWTSDEQTSHRILDAFLDGGGSFVDTADSYTAFAPGNSGGESETVIGSWLSARGNRDKVVIGTKVSQHPEFKGLAAKNVAAAADASLQRLRTDYIDVYFAHFDDETVPLAETVEAFDALRQAGKIRAVALSNYSAERITEWFGIARREGYELPSVLQPHYNLVTRKAYENDLLPVIEREGLAAVPYFSLASGFLTGKYRTKDDITKGIRARLAGQYFSDAGLEVVRVLDDVAAAHGQEIPAVALAWLRSRPGVVAPIASARSLEQLPPLLASAAFELSADEIAELDEVSARV